MRQPSYDVWIVTKTERYQVLSEVSRRCAERFRWVEGRKEIVLSACSEREFGSRQERRVIDKQAGKADSRNAFVNCWQKR